MVHALLLCDLEGIAGIYDLHDMPQCHRLYNKEVSVYVNTLIAWGCSKITICDTHSQGDMITLDALDVETSGTDISIVAQAKNLSFEDPYDFAFMIGFHGREDSIGILPHTWRFDFKSMFLKNATQLLPVPIGEVEIFARWLGAHSVPVIMVSGDVAAISEANQFNPYRIVCCVKSVYEQNAHSLDYYDQKITTSINAALSLDRSFCVSHDAEPVYIEFQNQDLAVMLSTEGYQKTNNHLEFKDCADFMNHLYPLIQHMNQFNQQIWQDNVDFVRKIRTLVKDVDRETFITSEYGKILGKSLYFLDAHDRNKVLASLQQNQ